MGEWAWDIMAWDIMAWAGITTLVIMEWEGITTTTMTSTAMRRMTATTTKRKTMRMRRSMMTTATRTTMMASMTTKRMRIMRMMKESRSCNRATVSGDRCDETFAFPFDLRRSRFHVTVGEVVDLQLNHLRVE